MRIVALFVLATSLSSPLPLGAKSKQARPREWTDLLILPTQRKQRANKDLVRAFDQALTAQAKRSSVIKALPLSGSVRSKRRLVRRFKRCRGRSKCLARLVKRHRARELLVSEARADGGGIRVLLQVFGARGTLKRQITATVLDESETVVAAHFSDIFGVEPDPEIEMAFEAASATEVAQEIDVRIDSDSESPLPPGLQVENTEIDIVSGPARAPIGPSDAATKDADAGRLVLSEPDRVQPITLQSELPEEPSRAYAIGGWVCLGAGLALVGAGGVVTSTAQKDAQVEELGLTQVEAQAEIDSARKRRTVGVVAMGVGAVAAAAGAVFFMIDAADETPRLSPVLGDRHVGAAVSFRF